MHAIERYGLVALVLLVVSSAAVVVWDEEAANAPAEPEGEQLAALTQEEQVGERPPQPQHQNACKSHMV